MSRLRVLGISGSPNRTSKTTLALEAALDGASGRDESVETQLLALSELEIEFCDGRDPADYTGDTRTVIDHVRSADALVIGSPVYRGSYTGRLKNIFDVLPNDAMAGKPVGFVVTGGSPHHYLSLEHQFKPIAGFFNAYAVPGSVYADNDDFSHGALVPRCAERLRELGTALVAFATTIPRDVASGFDLGIARVGLSQS